MKTIHTLAAISLIAGAALIFHPGFSFSASSKGYTIGADTACSLYLNDVEAHKEAYEAYVMGFINGYNLATSSPAAKESTLTRAMPMISKYCKDSPSKNFMQVLLHVCKDLQLY